MRDFRDGRHDEFLDQALRALRELPDSPEATHLLRMIMTDPRTLERVTDPGFLTLHEAIRIAGRMQGLDAGTDVRLLHLLRTNGGCAAGDSWRASRVLEIVAAISDGKRILTLLPALLRHQDARVRSKAALLIGNFNRNLRWLEQRLSDADPRIRANAAQSAWGLDSREAHNLFLAATRDAHYRVVANGIVGLHRAGDLMAARIVQAMATHSDPKSRSAAVWAMGETEDPRFCPVLARIMSETAGGLRRNALRAMVRIRTHVAALAGRDRLRIGAARSAGHIEVQVRSAGGQELTGLPATAFVVTSGSEAVDISSVQPEPGYYRITFVHEPPAEVRVSVYATCGMGQMLAA